MPLAPIGRLTFAAAAVAALFSAGPAGAAEPEGNSLVIAGSLPLSGSEAASGAAFREGYELAIEQFNARGGVQVGQRHLRVKLVLVDDHGSPADSAKAAEQLLSEAKPVAMLGTFGSNVVEAQSTVAEQARVPYVAGSGTSSSLFQRGYRYLFGLQAPIKMMVNAQMDWVAEQQRKGDLPRPLRIALLWEQTSHGKDYQAGLRRWVERDREGYQIALEEAFPLGHKDFKGALARVRDARAEVLLVDAHLPEYLAMHEQYLAAGLCHSVLSYGARGPEREAFQKFGARNIAYVLSASWWSEQLATGGLNRVFVRDFQSKHHRAPDWYQAVSYEAARVLLSAIARAGSTEPEAIREQLAKLRIETILPVTELTFPADYGQQAHYQFVVQQNQPDGSSPIIFPSSVARSAGTVNPRCPRPPAEATANRH
jgi:branched-chain amino acid transport system substrate-binding protein